MSASDAAIEAFLSWMAVQKGASGATQKAYGSDLRGLDDFLRGQGADLGRPETVTRRHVQAYLAWLFRQGEAKSSMARKLAAARSFFRFQLRSGRVTENVAAQVRNPRQERRHPRALNVDETFALLDASPPSGGQSAEDERRLCRDLALAELLYGSGLRISEALGLNISDIRLQTPLVTVMGKTYISAQLLDDTDQLLKVFLNRFRVTSREESVSLGVESGHVASELAYQVRCSVTSRTGSAIDNNFQVGISYCFGIDLAYGLINILVNYLVVIVNFTDL